MVAFLDMGEVRCLDRKLEVAQARILRAASNWPKISQPTSTHLFKRRHAIS